MRIETISQKNIDALAGLFIALWPECNFQEELKNCQYILNSEKETCFLAAHGDVYIAFIYMNLRYDNVEGTSSSPVAYVEGIFVKPQFRNQGIGKRLIEIGSAWGLEKGCSELASDAEWHNENSINFHEKVGFKEINRIVNFARKIKT